MYINHEIGNNESRKVINMDKKLIKQVVIPIAYILTVVVFVMSIFYIQNAIQQSDFTGPDNFTYVSKDIFVNDVVPVVGKDVAIIRPYTDTNVKIAKYFYDYTGDKDVQERALIYYENTYMQNSGVDYSKGTESFDVCSILDGTVIRVKEDALFGNVVEIRHSNDMISVYQSLTEVTVKKDDTVKQGQVLGKSGLSNIDKDLGNHLHFEILHKGQVVNPENYYDKLVKDL